MPGRQPGAITHGPFETVSPSLQLTANSPLLSSRPSAYRHSPIRTVRFDGDDDIEQTVQHTTTMRRSSTRSPSKAGAAELRAAFQTMDEDCAGSLLPSEFRQVLERFADHFSSQEVSMQWSLSGRQFFFFLLFVVVVGEMWAASHPHDLTLPLFPKQFEEISRELRESDPHRSISYPAFLERLDKHQAALARKWLADHQCVSLFFFCPLPLLSRPPCL